MRRRVASSPNVVICRSVTPASRTRSTAFAQRVLRRRRSRCRPRSPPLALDAPTCTRAAVRTRRTPSSARAAAEASSFVSSIGRLARMRGSGRPARSAAARTRDGQLRRACGARPSTSPPRRSRCPRRRASSDRQRRGTPTAAEAQDTSRRKLVRSIRPAYLGLLTAKERAQRSAGTRSCRAPDARSRARGSLRRRADVTPRSRASTCRRPRRSVVSA